jgi:6,7-dimethyl-8-ribityllumazine synthase
VATASFSQNQFPYFLHPEKIKIGVVVADWNKHITEKLLQGAVNTLLQNQILEDQIKVLHVPGSFELPHGAQLLFEQNCDAVICLGCVIQGDTPHFDFVCQAATDGILQVGLTAKKPCVFGVITTLNDEQAEDRAGGKHGNKGAEAALTACWMIASRQHLNL